MTARVASIAALIALALLAWAGSHGDAQAQQSGTSAANDAEPLIQSRPRRARPRIRVQPLYPYRSYHTLYPPPYDIEYPGPNALRICTDWYAVEARPSGTVIVPRMRCRWVRG
jgi:hypothetical protein